MKKKLLTGIALFLSVFSFAQALTSSDLPIIIINTNGQTIVNDPKIIADMGIIYNGPGARNYVTDAFNHYNGKIGIEIRGQSSQMFPMKSYGFELWDNSGSSINRSLFGLPSESDWVLYAPYTDKTLMRNFLAYTMSREMGHWAANCRYVEVIIDGDYKGIYVFMEKIKRGSGRVPVSKINTTDVSGDAVTGGYIFSIDKEANGWFSQYVNGQGTTSRTQFSYVYPKETAIAAQQKIYLQSYVDSFEMAITGTNYQDKQNGWRRFAEPGSFIDYFVVNEISKNVDGYRLSTYLYKDKDSKGGKIVAGPVWDYDLAFRNANYCEGSNTNGWGYQFNTVCAGDYWQVPFWWNKFLKDTAFKNNLKCRWKQLRQTSLSLARLNTLIDSVIAVTGEARQRHFQRWPVLGQYIWPNPEPIPASYDGEIQALKAWVNDRLIWLDTNIPNEGPCADYPASVNESIMILLYPNPFRGNVDLTVRSRIAQTVRVNVYDVSGRILYQSKHDLGVGYNKLPIVSAQWSAGMYFFSFETSGGEKFVRKAIKQ